MMTGSKFKRRGPGIEMSCLEEIDICTSIGIHHDFLSRKYLYSDISNAVSIQALYIDPADRMNRNGIIFKLLYRYSTNDGGDKVDSSCVLKCTKQKQSRNDKSTATVPDNLYYEFLVGHEFVNDVISMYPFFIATHGCFLIRGYDDLHALHASGRNIDGPEFKSRFIQEIQNRSGILNDRRVCTDARRYCVLLEFIPNAVALRSLLYGKLRNRSFLYNELVKVLFNIYAALHFLKRRFTHYDLHDGNIVLSQIPETHFKYVYKGINDDGTDLVFFSMYVPKIIDYGRCFFVGNNTSANNIKHELERVTVYDNCKSMGWLINPNPAYEYRNNFFVKPWRKNESHDLKLLWHINRFKDMIPPCLKDALSHLQYEGEYGTPEIVSDGERYKRDGSLCSVTDAFHALKHVITHMNEDVNYRDDFGTEHYSTNKNEIVMCIQENQSLSHVTCGH